MKQLSARFIGSLCVAAGSLIATLPAQAIVNSSIRCEDAKTIAEVVNGVPVIPGYLGCTGPTDRPGPVFDGNPTGDPGGLKFTFRKELRNIYTDTFVFQGYSEDPTTGIRDPNSPFRNDPHGPTGTLSFRDRLVGAFVLALEGERSLTVPNSSRGSNFSFYLFNADALGSTVNTAGLAYDTKGLSSADGTTTSPSLAFAGLYVQKGGVQGGVIPEPAGLALLATAFGALALTSRRRSS